MPARTAAEVRVVGCAGSHFDPARQEPCSSYLLTTPTAALLLDCGHGSYEAFGALSPVVVLDGLVVSHVHGDHAGELGRFIEAATWRNRPRVLGPSDALGDRRDRALPQEAEIVEAHDGDAVTVGAMEITFSLTAHQVPTLAVAIDVAERRFVYSADTGPAWRPPDRFKDADLALVECTFVERGDDDLPFHLDAREAAGLARTLRAKRTILTHAPAGDSYRRRLALARREAPGQRFEAARSGRRFIIE